MEKTNNTCLKFIEFKEFSLWDVKRLFLSNISSEYEIVPLRDIIQERSEKNNLFDFPNEKFGILGVNNKEGIFDAYEEFGKNINQPYKRVCLGDLAYNPYRVNVGSVGMKKEKHKFDYISPAYVVFFCDKKKLLPDYFYLVFKSNLFSGLVNENTTGSVRQNLKFSTLAQIKIPVPSLDEQNRIVEEYNKKLQDSIDAQTKTLKLEKEIETYLMEELGIENEINKRSGGLKFVEYKNFDRWDSKGSGIMKSNFDICKVGELIQNIGTGTTPPTGQRKYFDGGNINFYTPADLTNKVYLDNSERKITESAFTDKKARKFKKGTILFVGIGSTVGKVGIINNDFAASNQQITGLFFNQHKVNNLFAYYFFDNFIDVTTQERTVATIPIVNQEKILNIPFPLPSLEIQEKIVKHIGGLKEEIKRLKDFSEELKENAKKDFEKEIFS